MNIEDSLLDFKNLINSSQVISLPKIEWWLLKYSDKYKTTYDFVQSQHRTQQEDGTQIRLPPFWEQSKKDIFLELYTSLEKVTEFHRNEDYFTTEIKDYQKIKHSPVALKKWTAKNENLGAQECLDFYINYLEYSDKPQYLQVCFNPLFSKEYIYIDLLDFKNTIEFIEIFDDLYWVKKVLPESLE